MNVFTHETFGKNPTYQQPPRRKIGRVLLTLWAILSLLWAGAVAYDLYQRATTQANMSRAVERELDQGLTPASCTGVQCSGQPEAPAGDENWSDIVSTYVRFGSGQVAECIFGPPLALFAIGFGGLFFYRNRFTRRTADPGYE